GGDDYYGIGGAGGGGGSNLVPTGGSAGIDATGIPVITLSYGVPVVVSPTSVTFGDQAIGSTSTAKTATLSVTGTAAVAIDSVTLGGANAGDFAIAGDTCSAKSVAAGETCTVQITFQPTATGVRSASLAFHDDATDSPQVVTLSGNGTTSADVGVTITGPAATKNNSQNSYVVKVTNAGPSQALGVTMTAQVPPGTRFAGVSTTQGTCTNPSIGATTGTITCALGDLAKDAAALDTVTLRFSMNGKGGSIALTARATSASTPDPSLGNNVASINTAVGK
ncbi:MAG: choice-of-anchor D domain-containing protein, partial [Polyangiales bacterium]